MIIYPAAFVCKIHSQASITLKIKCTRDLRAAMNITSTSGLLPKSTLSISNKTKLWGHPFSHLSFVWIFHVLNILVENLFCVQNCRAARGEQPCVVMEYGILEVCIPGLTPVDIDMSGCRQNVIRSVIPPPSPATARQPRQSSD